MGYQSSRCILEVHWEDWYHSITPPDRWREYDDRIEEPTDWLLTVLAERGIHATWYCLGDLVERYPHLVRRMVLAGHTLGSHGYYHREGEREHDLSDWQTRQLLQQITGQTITHYTSPYWSTTPRRGYCGGVFFRLLPLWVLVRAAHQSGVAYVHPWEFDLDQPRIRPERLVYQRHYWGLSTSLRDKFKHLLDRLTWREP